MKWNRGNQVYERKWIGLDPLCLYLEYLYAGNHWKYNLERNGRVVLRFYSRMTW